MRREKKQLDVPRDHILNCVLLYASVHTVYILIVVL